MRQILLIAIVCFSTACTVGPNYKRPSIATPQSFRAPDPLPPGEAASFADLKWFEVFKDEQLQALIRQALERNYDLRDAAARVEEARAALGITRSDQFPSFGAGGAVEINRLSREGATPIPPQLLSNQNRNFGTAALQLLSFEVDIWGKLRRATEAARANLLSADENRKVVVTTLVSDVASAYLTLRELDYELEISRRTLQTRQDSLELTRSREVHGVSTELDLRQAEQLVYTASETIPQIQKQIEQTENQIRLLLGESPSTVLRGQKPDRTATPAGSPTGLALRTPRTPARHSGGRAEPDCRERTDRRGTGSLLPDRKSQRRTGRRQHTTVEPVQRTGQPLESGAPDHPADIHCWAAEIGCQTCRGRARAHADSL